MAVTDEEDFMPPTRSERIRMAALDASARVHAGGSSMGVLRTAVQYEIWIKEGGRVR